jgi:hypothetical protein
MSDRTWAYVVVRLKDVKKFEEEGFRSEYVSDVAGVEDEGSGYEDVAPGVVRLFDEEIAGGTGDLQELAAKGLPFYGWHGNHYTFDAGCFVSTRKQFIEVETCLESGPVVRVERDGKANKNDLARVRQYYRLLKSVEKRFGIKEETYEEKDKAK